MEGRTVLSVIQAGEEMAGSKVAFLMVMGILLAIAYYSKLSVSKTYVKREGIIFLSFSPIIYPDIIFFRPPTKD